MSWSTFAGHRCQRTRCSCCMTFQRTNQSRRSWLSVLPYTGIEGKRTDGDLSSSAEPARPHRLPQEELPATQPAVTSSFDPVPVCAAGGGQREGDGRYSGVVLERALLAASQCNLGWLEEHRRGDVPASRGPLSGVSSGVLHLYDTAGFRKVGPGAHAMIQVAVLRRRNDAARLPSVSVLPKQWHLIWRAPQIATADRPAVCRPAAVRAVCSWRVRRCAQVARTCPKNPPTCPRTTASR